MAAGTGRRVGLLGGTFDPPHIGHLVVAECARVELDLDEVRFVVAGQPWMKGDESDPAHRVAMTRLAVEDDAQLVVDDRETRRDGPTYTADTLTELSAEEPDTTWFFLLGTDAYAQLDRWHRIDEAIALATFVVVSRPDAPTLVAPPVGDRDVVRLDVPQLQVSSTDLRDRFAAGRAVRYLVPPQVVRYVRDHGLYGSSHGE